MERLQKVIAASGITSRRKAEELIKQGKVTVNGEVITELGYKVGKKAEIKIDGKLITKEELCYFLLHKPKKTICSVKDQFQRNTVVDIIACQERIFPVGRLDYNTTGVLVLTNDGSFANELTHPSYQIEKTYEATVKGIVSSTDIKKLQKGVLLDDGRKSQPAEVRVLEKRKDNQTTRLELTIKEGRNHQVKNMLAAVNYEVIKLHRRSFGVLTCDGLELGGYRRMKPFEIKQMRSLAKEGKAS